MLILQSTVDIQKIRYIQFESIYIVLQIIVHKNHLFASLLTPSICPLLHIAIYISSNYQPFIITSGDNGPDEGRLCSWLHKTSSGMQLKIMYGLLKRNFIL